MKFYCFALLALFNFSSAAFAQLITPTKLVVKRIDRRGDVSDVNAEFTWLWKDNKDTPCANIVIPNIIAKDSDITTEGDVETPFTITGTTLSGCMTDRSVRVTLTDPDSTSSQKFHFLIDLPANAVAAPRAKLAEKPVETPTPSPAPADAGCFSQKKIWWSGDIIGGYLDDASSSSALLSQSGGLFGLQAGIHLRNLCIGELQGYLGYERASTSVTTSDHIQSIAVWAPALSVGYLHTLFDKNFFVGALLKGFIGQGAHLDVLTPDNFQATILIGPQIEYRIPLSQKMELALGVAGLFDVGVSQQGIFELPIHAGIQLFFDTIPDDSAALVPKSEATAPAPNSAPAASAETPAATTAPATP